MLDENIQVAKDLLLKAMEVNMSTESPEDQRGQLRNVKTILECVTEARDERTEEELLSAFE